MLTAGVDFKLISLCGANSKMPAGSSGRFSKSTTCCAFARLQMYKTQVFCCSYCVSRCSREIRCHTTVMTDASQQTTLDVKLCDSLSELCTRAVVDQLATTRFPKCF